ncbi:MAG: Nif3-like dinuclear metal center hexameric protein [Synergistaceae bacterium]|jgi:dinuclear metal center YbgI/SA1388 family protein|nr:Nif3-like dinuclear metal center hexameric protein [Synergistaceae bacterium]
MKVREIVRRIEEQLPLSWSEEWDNSGLLVGDPESSADKIAVALDATEHSILRAIGMNCGMLVTHHPVIFRSIDRVVLPSPEAQAISASLKGGTAVYSSHTSWDSSPEGVNVILSNLLGLKDFSPLLYPRGGAWGMGSIGRLRRPATLSSLARAVRDAWGLSYLSAYGDGSAPLNLAALCGGAGGDFLQAAIDRGADVYITADVSYHCVMQAQAANIALITVNHGEMEAASLPGLRDLLKEATGLGVELLENSNWIPSLIGAGRRGQGRRARTA